MIRALTDGLLAAVLAPSCAACREPLDHPTRSVVCAQCWGAIQLLRPPFCVTCGDSLASWRTDAHAPRRCARCRRIQTRISLARAVGHYDGAMRAILHALKYDRRRSIAVDLSALMRAHGRDVLDGADCAVPVPLHWRRLWTRGFNQAAELARGLGLPMVHALGRGRHTASQIDLPAARRHANVRDAFVLARRARLRNTCVVLVDDVRTTGATVEACARVLLESGAREVRALTAARVVRQPPHAPR